MNPLPTRLPRASGTTGHTRTFSQVRSPRRALLLLALGVLVAEKAPAQTAPGRLLKGGLREISWDDLIPEDWDPAASLPFKDIDQISDDDPRSIQLMDALRELWDKAPTRKELDGLRIRLPGYVVPLDMLGGKIREFLLVPYFGACIHSPPPPANQILQVRLKSPQDLQTMDAVWVNGKLSIVRAETSMGVSGYALEAERVEPYREPRN